MAPAPVNAGREACGGAEGWRGGGRDERRRGGGAEGETRGGEVEGRCTRCARVVVLAIGAGAGVDPIEAPRKGRRDACSGALLGVEFDDAVGGDRLDLAVVEQRVDGCVGETRSHGVDGAQLVQDVDAGEEAKLAHEGGRLVWPAGQLVELNHHSIGAVLAVVDALCKAAAALDGGGRSGERRERGGQEDKVTKHGRRGTDRKASARDVCNYGHIAAGVE